MLLWSCKTAGNANRAFLSAYRAKESRHGGPMMCGFTGRTQALFF
jgi:hypothetical protein